MIGLKIKFWLYFEWEYFFSNYQLAPAEGSEQAAITI